MPACYFRLQTPEMALAALSDEALLVNLSRSDEANELVWRDTVAIIKARGLYPDPLDFLRDELRLTRAMKEGLSPTSKRHLALTEKSKVAGSVESAEVTAARKERTRILERLSKRKQRLFTELFPSPELDLRVLSPADLVASMDPSRGGRSIIIVAPRDHGKSHLQRAIVRELTRQGHVSDVLVLTSTGAPEDFPFLSPSCVKRFSNDLISSVLQRQRLDKSIRTLIVVDDAMASEAERSTSLRDLFANGRNLNAYVVLCSQMFTRVTDPTVRGNSDYIFFAGQSDKALTDLRSSEFVGLAVNAEQTIRFVNANTGPRHSFTFGCFMRQAVKIGLVTAPSPASASTSPLTIVPITLAGPSGVSQRFWPRGGGYSPRPPRGSAREGGRTRGQVLHAALGCSQDGALHPARGEPRPRALGALQWRRCHLLRAQGERLHRHHQRPPRRP